MTPMQREQIAYRIWEFVIDSLQPQFTRTGEFQRWSDDLIRFIQARLAAEAGEVAPHE